LFFYLQKTVIVPTSVERYEAFFGLNNLVGHSIKVAKIEINVLFNYLCARFQEKR